MELSEPVANGWQGTNLLSGAADSDGDGVEDVCELGVRTVTVTLQQDDTLLFEDVYQRETIPGTEAICDAEALAREDTMPCSERFVMVMERR